MQFCKLLAELISLRLESYIDLNFLDRVMVAKHSTPTCCFSKRGRMPFISLPGLRWFNSDLRSCVWEEKAQIFQNHFPGTFLSSCVNITLYEWGISFNSCSRYSLFRKFAGRTSEICFVSSLWEPNDKPCLLHERKYLAWYYPVPETTIFILTFYLFTPSSEILGNL